MRKVPYPMGGALDTTVLVFTVIFSLASVLVPDVLNDAPRKRRIILGAMALLLVGLTIWQQIAAAKEKQRADKDHNAEVASLEAQLEHVTDEAKSLAPKEPSIGRGAYSPAYDKDRLTILYKARNGGQLAAKGIVIYAATEIGDSTNDNNSRLAIFRSLAGTIGESRKESRGIVVSAELPFLENLPLRTDSDVLSSSDLEALRAGTKSAYVMFYLDYKGSRGNSRYAIFCDSWSGDLKEPVFCPGHAEDYAAIIWGEQQP